MTVDTAGDLWVATHGGGSVHHHTSDGQPPQVLAIRKGDTYTATLALTEGGPGGESAGFADKRHEDL